MEKKLGENIQGQATTLIEEIDALIKKPTAIDSRETRAKAYEIMGRTFAILKESGISITSKEGNELLEIIGDLTNANEEDVYEVFFDQDYSWEKKNIILNTIGDMLLTRANNYKDSGKVNEAIRCYEMAFAFGKMEAGAILANMYMSTDKEKAKKYLIEAITLGEYNASELNNYKSFIGWAYTNLGILYVEDDEDSLSNVEAVECFKRGADLGNALAYFYLGSMYENGIGCQINKRMAEQCYDLSNYLGNETAEFVLLNKLAVDKK